MTCIVAIRDGGNVILGGDSASVAGYDVRIIARPKVFVRGDLAIGYTDSFRMGQLLETKLEVPRDGFRDLVDELPDAVRKCFGDGGYKETDKGREEGGTFLVGWKGRIFHIGSDFQVNERAEYFDACGCGEQYARGFLCAVYGDSVPLFSIGGQMMIYEANRALECAARFSAGVRGPFSFVVAP